MISKDSNLDESWLEIGSQYQYVHCPKNVEDKLAFEAWKKGKQIIVHDGEEFGEEYDEAIIPEDVGGKLTYTARKDGKQFIVFDGKEIGTQYDSTYEIADIQGELAYIAEKDSKCFVVYQRKRLGEQYDGVSLCMSINDKLTYAAWKDDKRFIVCGDEEIATQFNLLYGNGVVDVPRKLAFASRKEGLLICRDLECGRKKWYINPAYEDFFRPFWLEEESLEVEIIHSLKDPTTIFNIWVVDGKEAYIAGGRDGSMYIAYGDEEGPHYDKIYASGGITPVGNKLAYVAEKRGEKFIVYNDEELGREYEDVTFLENIGGKLAFHVQKDSRSFIVMEN